MTVLPGEDEDRPSTSTDPDASPDTWAEPEGRPDEEPDYETEPERGHLPPITAEPDIADHESAVPGRGDDHAGYKGPIAAEEGGGHSGGEHEDEDEDEDEGERGHPLVEEVMGRLGDLRDRPVGEHAEVYGDLHERLQGALSEADAVDGQAGDRAAGVGRGERV